MRIVMTTLVVAFAATAADAQVVLRLQHRELAGGAESRDVVVSADNRRLRVDASADQSVIYDGAGQERVVLVVDHGRREYTALDESTLRALTAQLGPLLEQIGRQLEGQTVPPAGTAATGTRYERTGEEATRSGYLCEKYDVIVDGRREREVWVTDWSNVPGSTELRGAMQDLAAFSAELFAGLPLGGQLPELPFETGIDQVGGFPVATIELDGEGRPESETVLRSAESRPIEPSVFVAPAGYAKTTFGIR